MKIFFKINITQKYNNYFEPIIFNRKGEMPFLNMKIITNHMIYMIDLLDNTKKVSIKQKKFSFLIRSN